MKWLRCLLYIPTAIAVFLLSGYFTVNGLLKTGGTVLCPDLCGKDVDEARQLVRNAGLSLAITKYERRNDVPYNHITVQKPEANISTRKGRVVLVIVSEGPELVNVPMLTGSLLEKAEETLEAADISIGKIIYVPSPKVGEVIAQIPGGGENIIKGNGVTLFVGTEQKQFYMMPRITASELSDVSNEMKSKGIRHKISMERDESGLYSSPSIETSVPVKTIFKIDNEIKIKVIAGGYNE